MVVRFLVGIHAFGLIPLFLPLGAGRFPNCLKACSLNCAEFKNRLGCVQAQHPDPSQKLGQTVAIRLVQKLADSGYMAGKTLWKHLPGGGISGAFKDGMMLILYGIRSILIRIKGIKAISRDVWIGDLAHTHRADSA